MRQGLPVKYTFLHAHESQFSVTAMCRVLDVPRSGYYAWKRRGENPREAENRRLDEAIQRLFDRHKDRYGASRLTVELCVEG